MQSQELNAWQQRLARVEAEERLTAWQRAARNPLKRLVGLGFSKFIFPVTHNGWLTSCRTFFEEPMNVLLPSGLDIYLTGAKVHESELRLSRFFLRAIKPGMNVVDVGAHFGFYSLLANKLLNGNGSVIAIEPTPATHNVLQLNRRGVIIAMQLALSSHTGKTFFADHGAAASEANRVETSTESRQRIEVQTDTLDSLCNRLKAAPHLIKMDVEGHEAEAVEGGMQTLRNCKPIVVLELFNPNHAMFARHARVLDLMSQLNYTMHGLDNNGMPQRANNTHDIFDSNLDSTNVVFLPNS